MNLPFKTIITGLADYSDSQQSEYLQELEHRSTAGAIGLEYASLPLATQYHTQNEMKSCSKGTVVTRQDGTKLDARLVKNGT